MSLAGIAVGLIICDVALSGLSITAKGVVVATLIFWLVHLVVQFIALRILVRQPSVALAGLLALGSTVVSLLIVNAVVGGLHIRGVATYFWATLIVWATTALGDVIGQRMIRQRRRERRAA